MTETNPSALDDELLDVKHRLREPAYAGFWTRVGASIVDTIVLLPAIGLMMYSLLSLQSNAIVILVLLILMIYKPFMEFRYGATLGKMAVGIKVVDENQNPITLKHALLRDLPWLLSQLNASVGFIIGIFFIQSEDFGAQVLSNFGEGEQSLPHLMEPFCCFKSRPY
ncbi:RDD family protein [bacterium SCSIO 12741]|nr:RDD family protein [bacterium SCSIO 12741]